MSKSTEGASPKLPGESLNEVATQKVIDIICDLENPKPEGVRYALGVYEAIVRRHVEGRPAVSGKPLEIQSRDELLAYIRQRQAEQPQDVIERVARAICPFAFDSWDRNVAYSLKEGKTEEEAEDFAVWCDQGAHPHCRVEYARSAARAAIAAIGDGSATIASVSADTIEHLRSRLCDLIMDFTAIEYLPSGMSDKIRETIRPYLHQPSPPVDIETGAIACSQWVYGVNHLTPSWDRLSEEHRNEYREQAKATARAWGLRWE